MARIGVTSAPWLSIVGLQIQIASIRAAFLAGEVQLDRPLPVIHPVGHMYWSTNASESADFFTRYFSNATKSSTCETWIAGESVADAVCISWCLSEADPCMKLMFVTTSEHGSRQRAFVRHSEAEWRRVGLNAQMHRMSWDPYIDFHLGVRAALLFNFSRARRDGVLLQQYSHQSKSGTDGQLQYGPLRMHIPGTYHSIESLGPDPNVGSREFATRVPDRCRSFTSGIEFQIPKSWWKSTFSARDPARAAAFVKRALGAVEVPSPFPWPQRPGCFAAKWVVLPAHPQRVKSKAQDFPEGFMLHFVRSIPTDGNRNLRLIGLKGKLSTAALAEVVEAQRDLSAGRFDEYMYSNVIFWTDSLDPFVERLSALKVSFLPLHLEPKVFAIFLSVPGEGIVLQLRSSKLTKVAPRELRTRHLKSKDLK
eukprot:TRINITY_DN45577_c0_g1_i1.p1 TRINITY_DN45577_c0_g1~~TRINITY_DN45577_c0_g1_i1.p1  ORF type:complete len:441 (+),score=51.19 TRINITY_DN45577_c0_g1_i1:57-1325(+)